MLRSSLLLLCLLLGPTPASASSPRTDSAKQAYTDSAGLRRATQASSTSASRTTQKAAAPRPPSRPVGVAHPVGPSLPPSEPAPSAAKVRGRSGLGCLG